MSSVDLAILADRGVGETAAAEALPAGVVDLFGLLTRLGDPMTLLVVVVVGYLLADHLGVSSSRMAVALALAFGAFAVTLALKHAFALPRPPGAGTDGYGFPSGHAIGATVVYGGLVALLGERRRRRRAVVAAAALVTLVSLSRIVIGVHYLVDVVAGVAVGVGFLAVTLRVGPGLWPDRVDTAAVDRAFAVAVGTGVVALGTAVVTDTVVAAAAAVGGWIGWRFVTSRDRPVDDPSTARLVVSVAALPPALVVVAVVLGGGVSLPVAAGLAGVVVALLLALPDLSASVVEKNAGSSR